MTEPKAKLCMAQKQPTEYSAPPCRSQTVHLYSIAACDEWMDQHSRRLHMCRFYNINFVDSCTESTESA